MKRLILSLFLFVQTVQIVCAWNGSIATSYAGGDGSQSNPYQIATAEQLALLAHNVNEEGITYSGQYFILTNDIDLFGLNGTDTIQWTPIGIIAENFVQNGEDAHPDHRYFKGIFDGTNHTISNLYINDSTRMSGGGLFGNVAYGRLQNIKLSNVYVRVHKYASALCANAAYAMFIDNCHVLSGKVTVEHSYAGSIAAFIKSYQEIAWSSYNYDLYYYFYNSSITNCTNHAMITMSGSSSFANNGNWSMIGGIVGHASGSSGATFWASTHVGGSDGKPYSMTIKNCTNYGDVTGSVGTGGICGSFSDGNSNGGGANDTVLMDRCVNYGTIYYGNIRSGNSVWNGYIGGITGRFIGAGIIQRCLNAGDIKKDRNHDLSGTNFITCVGGIIGYQSTTVSRVQYCVNIGNCDSVSEAGGIVGNNRGRINYCLNAGSFSGDYKTGGIAGYLQTGSFVTACVSSYYDRENYENCDLEASIVGAWNSVYAPPRNLRYNDYTSSCFFDWQWCPYPRETRGEPNYYHGQILTTHMLGESLQDSLSTNNWVFTEGMYPRPKGVENEPIVIVAATPAYLKVYSDSVYDGMRMVHDGLEVSTLNGVTWTSESPLQISGTHVAITGAVPPGEKYQLYAHLGEVKKRIEFSVYSFNPDTVLPIDTTVIPIDTIINPIDTIVNPVDTTHVTPTPRPTNGNFTINAQGERVMFAPGNMQYQASPGTHLCADGTTQQGVWRFAEHQWDYVGDATNGTVYLNGAKCNNENISSTYSGWIDLFGWGTSGWNSGASAYQPYDTSTTASDYYPGGTAESTLTGTYAYADWAVYNQIGEDAPGTWRTLTADEWSYLLDTRNNSANLKGRATVNNVKGCVLLPDDWTVPTGLSFIPGTSGYETNVYSASQWEQMEAAGAIFLPVAGYRQSTAMFDLDAFGYCWSTTPYSTTGAYEFSFSGENTNMYNGYRYRGRSLRPVKMLNQNDTTQTTPIDTTHIEPIIPQTTSGRFTVNAGGETIVFAPGNLQYQASTNTWRFAEHQYDYVGDATRGNVYQGAMKCDNAQISSTYSGWIDMFRWGTSGWDNGSNAYMPYSTNYGSNDYIPFGIYDERYHNLTGIYANSDWGIYNQIGNDAPGTWRTPTYDEWNYIFSLRPNAANLRGQASIVTQTETINGYILFPDSFVMPQGLTFVSKQQQGYDLYYETNVYSLEDWSRLENAGAVFLPASGYIYERVEYLMDHGFYWSSSCRRPVDSGDAAHSLSFCGTWDQVGYDYWDGGRSVRLISNNNATVVPPPTGEPKAGYFSVSDSLTVRFAPGNLQYQASTDTWRFAEHQYDYVGSTVENKGYGTVYENGVKSDNAQASATYSGWIDMYNYGTSGWNSGANLYMPYNSSGNSNDFRPDGVNDYYMTGNYANADWGVYNQIGEDLPGTWRTPTNAEWEYLLNTRQNAQNLRAQAEIMTDSTLVRGYILLPDSFTMPSHLSMVFGEQIGYPANRYSLSDWAYLEHEGAIFLPASGIWTDYYTYFNECGYYWGSTASCIYFDKDWMYTRWASYSFKEPVRLIYVGLPNDTIAPPDTTEVIVPTTNGFTINAQGERIIFAPGNLLYNAAQGSHLCADGTTHPGTWRFADHQWDYVGDAYNGTVYWNGSKCNNENISSTYDGWIDLFGFGTSGWNSGANEYQPYASSSSYTDYYVGGGETNSLVGSYAYADWGIFNTIESYPCGTWRTLTLDEWDYLFTSRTDASMKYGQATVNNVAGYILLPDEWVIPAGLTFTPGPAVGYGANTYSLSEWEQMEQAGAVFLPAGGYRQGRSMQSVQANGDYYFSTANSYDATRFYFTSSSSSYSSFSGERYFGRALRLVRTPSTTPVVDPVYFSFSDSICAGETYAWEGSKFTEAGEYTKTLVSSLGGDSIVTLHLYSYSCEEVYEDVPFCYEERGMEAVLTIIDGENVNYQWEQKVNGEWQVLSAGYLSQTIQLPTSTTDTIYLRFVGSELLSNLIVNGDFEAGNLGFETGYTYDSLAIYTEGTYTVTNDVNLVHADAQCAEDHTTGEGMMMAINGGSNANANVWTQTVTGLLPNTDYAFSAWAALWTDYGFNYPELEFSINGELQGQRFSPNEGTCNWTQLYTIWNSGNHTSAQIRLVDQQTGEMANDFCIDDIYFSPLLGRLDGAIKYLKVYLLQPIDTTIVHRTINEGDTCSWEGDIYTSAGNYVKTFVSAEGCDSLVMLQLTVMDPLPEDQAFYFSTSDTTAVFFSPGNLQYKGTPGTHLCADGTTQQGVWRFAEHQWSYVGTQNDRVARSYNVVRQHGNVYENGVICDNANASSTYSGWIDLFTYGTSGWNSGVAKYQPWTGSISNDEYVIESYWSHYFHFGDLTGEYAYADWGVYNQIGEYAPGTWRTPTHDEWIYIVSQRPNADSLRGIGMIDGVPGFILLPDNSRWDSLPFNPGLIEYADMNWSIVSNNTIDYAINPYTSAQWEQMEAAGAIFFPAAGHKTQDNWISVYTTHWDPNTYTDVFKQSGDYMSSTFIEHANNAGTPGVKVLAFDPYKWYMSMGYLICNGVSVRLIRDCRTCNPQNDLPTPITAPVSAEPQKAKIILQDNTIYILLPDSTRYDITGRKVE